MKRILLSALIIASITSCKKNITTTKTTAEGCWLADTTIPACITNMITSLQQQAPHNAPAEIYEYYYNSQRVFYVTSDCCDQYNYLYDTNCNVLCAPDGGFSGGGDNLCTDFHSTATNKRLVWRDPR